jgi:hypothetical protein
MKNGIPNVETDELQLNNRLNNNPALINKIVGTSLIVLSFYEKRKLNASEPSSEMNGKLNIAYEEFKTLSKNNPSQINSFHDFVEGVKIWLKNHKAFNLYILDFNEKDQSLIDKYNASILKESINKKEEDTDEGTTKCSKQEVYRKCVHCKKTKRYSFFKLSGISGVNLNMCKGWCKECVATEIKSGKIHQNRKIESKMNCSKCGLPKILSQFVRDSKICRGCILKKEAVERDEQIFTPTPTSAIKAGVSSKSPAIVNTPPPKKEEEATQSALRECVSCECWKNDSEFYRSGFSASGSPRYRSECKGCVKKKIADKAKAEKERLLASKKYEIINKAIAYSHPKESFPVESNKTILKNILNVSLSIDGLELDPNTGARLEASLARGNTLQSIIKEALICLYENEKGTTVKKKKKNRTLNRTQKLRAKGEKACKSCLQVRELKEFVKSGIDKNGEAKYRSECSLCRLARPDKSGISPIKYIGRGKLEQKECKKCHVKKYLSAFPKSGIRSGTQGFRSTCSECCYPKNKRGDQ